MTTKKLYAGDLKAGIYQHYKGGYYQVFGVGAHSETDERMVVYLSVFPVPGPPLPGPRIRIRPANMWEETVTWPDGSTGPRFKYVGEEIVTSGPFIPEPGEVLVASDEPGTNEA